jgi:prepilin-type N-terminal cleavage/methylation domain-containing protein
MRRQILHSAGGFTLIEVVVTVVIVGIIFVLGGLMMGRAFETYDATQKTTDVDWQGRVALERMVRELRNIRSDTDLTMSTTSTDPIFFADPSGATACFCYESVTKTVRRGSSVAPNCGSGGVAPTASCGATGTQALADNVIANGLNIYYYTATGSAATSSSQVQAIALSLAVTEGTITETYRAGVQPRGVP